MYSRWSYLYFVGLITFQFLLYTEVYFSTNVFRQHILTTLSFVEFYMFGSAYFQIPNE